MLIEFASSFREGQPLKLPETKKTLLFTFNGEHFDSSVTFSFFFTLKCLIFSVCVCFLVPGMGNTSPKDMDSLLPLMNMVIYSIDKVKKLRLNREVSCDLLYFVLYFVLFLFFLFKV